MRLKKEYINISNLRIFSIAFILFLIATLPAQSQVGSQQFRLGNGIFRVSEPGQLADSVNVWGDVTTTGRFLIPQNTTLPQLMSYAGGPRGLESDIFSLSKVKIRVNISRYIGPNNENAVVENFEFSYKDPIPVELQKYDLKNNDVVSIEVKRRPNFLDYLRIVGPILSTITTILVIQRSL